MTHFFEVDIATKYGIEAAIILHDLFYWIVKNKANDINYYDGRYWDYNSTAALKELYPYMKEYTITSTLKKLKEKGLIITGCFNKQPFDRTTWYTLTDDGWALFKGKEIDVLKTGNALFENEVFDTQEIKEPIPIVKVLSNESTDINNLQQSMFSYKSNEKNIGKDEDIDSNISHIQHRDTTKKFIPPTIDEVSAYCKERKNGIDAQSFIDFYESKGWMIGKNKMKDWKAAVRTWERNKIQNTTRRERGIYESDEEDETPIPGLW